MNKTFISKDDQQVKWYLVDAKNQTLGRLSSQIASTLKGKNNFHYTPDRINNSYIIVINAKDIQVTGNKKLQKLYYKHSGRPGGLKTETFEQLQKRIPTRIIEKSVKGMLPKNTLGRQLFRHLKVYSGNSHPHNCQKPTNLQLK
uniref:Large ribosomal subunit protein uL13c n=1 Tax=Calliarthron tuberculosum TaxID=48942 RepID=M4IU50_CALTB|nr:50S ribosomal protein L13 [Calliarthron tuberculosum]AGA63818.1 50S ribosomal protein L13 [Calliarthron tuberculosum]